MTRKYVFVLDVDGTLTDGKMIYSKEGKTYKSFGCDDWNALHKLQNYALVQIVTADKKGFAISARRIEDECDFVLDLVPGNGQQRWDWIRDRYPDYHVTFMGDGLLDWVPLSEADYGVTTPDALEHVQINAHFVTQRSGGNRAVAEAVLHYMEKFFHIKPRSFCT